MAGETRVIAFGSGNEDVVRDNFTTTPVEVAPAPDLPEQELGDEYLEKPRVPWIAPAFAIAAVVAWTGFFAWASLPRLTALSAPADAAALVGDWAVPVLLVCVVWLLAMRSSRREAARFGDAARLLSDESTRLEARLVTVNRELSLAREFIAAQSRDLDALGRMATERISEHAAKLQGLVAESSARVDSIGSVSETALDNMEKLRGQLPVIASSTKDVTNNIGNAGRAAHAQLAELINGFKRLNEFGQASERQVHALRSTVDEAIGEFSRQSDRMGEVAAARFATLTDQGETLRDALASQEIDALAAIRTRAATLAEELDQARQQLDSDEEQALTSLRARLGAIRDEAGVISRSVRDTEGRALESWREAVAQVEQQVSLALGSLASAQDSATEALQARARELEGAIAGLETQLAERSKSFASDLAERRACAEAEHGEALQRMGDRLAAFDADMVERRAGHERMGESIAAQSEALEGRLAGFEQRLTAIASHGEDADRRVAASLQSLGARLAESRSALDGADGEIAALIRTGERLNEVLQSARQDAAIEFPALLEQNLDRLAEAESRIASLIASVERAHGGGDSLSTVIDETAERLRTLFDDIATLQQGFDANTEAQGAALASLRETLAELDSDSSALAAKAKDELAGALDKLGEASRQAVAAINTDGAAAIARLAEQLGSESSVALERAMRASAAETAGQLEIAAAHAAGVSREAATQLRDQLAKVNELVGNLERRVIHARARAEDKVDNDFSRRAALITESLNSNAIDIAKALAADVADTAWASYLRGDRGIFTRRAVSLLDSGEAKEIAQVYDRDETFRAHVSRYIHDFEAMLRQVLSTRDGHSLGVTLLSSDLGKLYVAMAQAIERFRK